jgi:hypothetical protein
VAADCLSCHRDYHERAFEDTPGGTLCENCHSQRKWMPTSYDIERHNRETEFALTGAHLAAPCFRCHENTELGRESSEYRFTSTDCASCHRGDDLHGTQFEADPCTECHDTASFEIAVFDHDATRYPLDGAHRSVACESCHREETAGDLVFRRYVPLGTECRDCHGETGVER